MQLGATGYEARVVGIGELIPLICLWSAELFIQCLRPGQMLVKVDYMPTSHCTTCVVQQLKSLYRERTVAR